MDLYGILSEASVGNLYNLKTLSEKDQLMNQLKFEYFQMYKIKRKNWICIKKKNLEFFKEKLELPSFIGGICCCNLVIDK